MTFRALRRNHLAPTLVEAIAKKKGLSLSGCLGLVVRTWKHGCGPGHTGQRTRETTERRWDMMQGQFFLVDGFSWSPPGAERCSAPSWTLGVRTPAACQSSQAVRLAWARRPRRLTPLPWPSPRGLRARRGNGVWRPLRRLL